MPPRVFQSDFDRQLYRITLVGAPLVGIDGKPSRALERLPILSAAEELWVVQRKSLRRLKPQRHSLGCPISMAYS
jgi:hypothetical protein